MACRHTLLGLPLRSSRVTMGQTTLGATAMDVATALAWALLSLAAAAVLGQVILIAGLALMFAQSPRLAQQPGPGAILLSS